MEKKRKGRGKGERENERETEKSGRKEMKRKNKIGKDISSLNRKTAEETYKIQRKLDIQIKEIEDKREGYSYAKDIK